jgi:hypothetical protein
MSALARDIALRTLTAFATAICLVPAQPAIAQQAPEQAASKKPRAFEIAPRAYVQLDWRGYPDWTVAPGTGRLEFDTFEVRRLRAGIDGRFRRVAFEVTIDPEDFDGTIVKDAYAQLRITRVFRVRAGQFKLPGSREYHISARNVDFLERSALASSLAAGRDIGVMLTGEIGTDLEYQAGVFAGDGNGRAARAGRTAAGGVNWDLAGGFEIGGSASWGDTSSVDSDPANGLEGRTASGYRFFERVYVQGHRVRLGGDAQFERGPWRLTGEVMRTRDGRARQGLELEDLPPVLGVGWSVAVTRQFGRNQGTARSRIREWNVGLRLDGLSFDDEGQATSTDSVRPRATDVRRKAAQTLTASMSWGPVRWVRLITDAAIERYDEARSAPEAGRRGPYWALGSRLQLELPW